MNINGPSAVNRAPSSQTQAVKTTNSPSMSPRMTNSPSMSPRLRKVPGHIHPTTEPTTLAAKTKLCRTLFNTEESKNTEGYTGASEIQLYEPAAQQIRIWENKDTEIDLFKEKDKNLQLVEEKKKEIQLSEDKRKEIQLYGSQEAEKTSGQSSADSKTQDGKDSGEEEAATGDDRARTEIPKRRVMSPFEKPFGSVKEEPFPQIRFVSYSQPISLAPVKSIDRAMIKDIKAQIDSIRKIASSRSVEIVALLLALYKIYMDESQNNSEVREALYEAAEQVLKENASVVSSVKADFEKEFAAVAKLKTIVMSDKNLSEKDKEKLVAEMDNLEIELREEYELAVEAMKAVTQALTIKSHEIMADPSVKNLFTIGTTLFTAIISSRVGTIVKLGKVAVGAEITVDSLLGWALSQEATPTQIKAEIAKVISKINLEQSTQRDWAKLEEVYKALSSSTLSGSVGKAIEQAISQKYDTNSIGIALAIAFFNELVISKEVEKIVMTPSISKEDFKSMLEQNFKPFLRKQFDQIRESAGSQHQQNLQRIVTKHAEVTAQVEKAAYDASYQGKIFNSVKAIFGYFLGS